MQIGRILKTTVIAALLTFPLHAQGIGETQNGGISIAGYDHLERNNNTSDFNSSNFMAGLQYWVYRQCAIRSEYVHKSPRTGLPTDQWITQFQIAF